MARLRKRVARAAAIHEPAAATIAAVGLLLQGCTAASAAADHHAEQGTIAAALRVVAARLAPGWLGAPLDALAAATPLGGPVPPCFVRIGQAQPLDDTRFPVVVPLLRAGHVAIDADARDPRVAGLLRSVLLRLLAAAPAGSLRVQLIDGTGVGDLGAGFSSSAIAPVVTDQQGLRSVLTEAERWVAGRPDDPLAPSLLLVIASLPELTDGSDLARISVLAKAGLAGRLHIIAAGWPPPPLTAETTQRPLPYSTQLALRNPHVWVGDPPGATFDPGGLGPGRLPAPVYLDPDPPPALVHRVCQGLAAGERGGLAAGERGGLASGVPAGVEPEPALWPEYIALAQRLAAVQLAAKAAVAEQEAARTSAMKVLGEVRRRADQQAAELAEAGRAAGIGVPRLAPDAARIAAARIRLNATGGSAPAAALAALGAASAALDDAAAALGPPDSLLRNLGVYGLFASVAAFVELSLILLLGRAFEAAIAGLPCALVLSGIAFLLAWTLIGVLDAPRRSDRSAAVGALVTGLSIVPAIAIAAVTAF